MQYPTSISWRIDLAAITTPDQLMSRERSHRIAKALPLLSAAGYTMRCDTVDEKFLDQFIPLYEEHIHSKSNGRLLDVRDRISASRQRGRVYESISLWQGDHLCGAQIYGIQQRSLSVAYRVFPYQLAMKLPISTSYIAERYVMEQALKYKKAQIIHGRDRNLYGIHAAIGLAEYKLNVGCVPYASSTAPFAEFAGVSRDHDTLVFWGSEPKQTITSATLFVRQGAGEEPTRHTSLFAQSAVRVTVEP